MINFVTYLDRLLLNLNLTHSHLFETALDRLRFQLACADTLLRLVNVILVDALVLGPEPCHRSVFGGRYFELASIYSDEDFWNKSNRK